jgi:hypothetical protein
MKAKDLDAKFDGGEDILGHLDLGRAKRGNLEQKRVNVDFSTGFKKQQAGVRTP